MTGEQHFLPPEVYARSAWGAMRAISAGKRHKPARIVLHHSWQPTAQQWDGKRTIKAIQRYHIIDNGWADIGYHYLIGPDGTIWAGRDPDIVGAHCGGTLRGGRIREFGNGGSIGICCIGNYDAEEPSEAMVYNLCQLIVWLQREYGIHHQYLYGHRECQKPPLAKTCPGKNLYERILGRNKWQDILKALDSD